MLWQMGSQQALGFSVYYMDGETEAQKGRNGPWQTTACSRAGLIPSPPTPNLSPHTLQEKGLSLTLTMPKGSSGTGGAQSSLPGKELISMSWSCGKATHLVLCAKGFPLLHPKSRPKGNREMLWRARRAEALLCLENLGRQWRTS